MTALSIVQDACGRMGLQQPSALFSSLSPQDIQFRTLLNQANRELARSGKKWTDLTKEATFTTTAAETQTNAIPSDFLSYLNDTMFDRTENRKLVGPLNPFEWQREKSGPVYTSVYKAFRFRGGSLLITPTPTAGNTVAYEYIKKYIVLDNTSTAKEKFTADSDTAILDEELLTLSIMWRFRKAKGLDYSEEFRTYELQLDAIAGQDGGAPTLSLSRGLVRRRFAANVKEGSWP